MSMWVLCLYVYWRAHVARSARWALLTGIVFGLALETKHNAWLLPVVCVVHAAIANRKPMGQQLRRGSVLLPASLVAMATIGPVVFYALWPWIWNDTLNRLQAYVTFHLNHEYYNIEFLHRNYYGPPSPKAYVPVMIVATIPLVTLGLFAIGAIDRTANFAARLLARARARFPAGPFARLLRSTERLGFDEDPRGTDLLLFLAFAVPLAPFFLDKTPIFGGTKHWLPSYPFLAIFAGRGFDVVANAMDRAIADGLGAARRRLAGVALFATVVGAPLAITAHSHPFGLSAYTPIVGGTAGGADLGLYRQFWGFTTQSLAPYFARAAPPGATVFIHDTAWDSWARMLDERRIRPDLRAVGSPAEAEFSIVHHELHMEEVDVACWVTYGHDNPDYVLTHDGVPIISVFRR
jgi:hypothetical protein